MPLLRPLPPGPEDPKWRLYEKLIADLSQQYPDCTVIPNHKVTGKSGCKRQVDVWAEGLFMGRIIKLAIECKFHVRRISIKEVDALFGLVHDIDADIGVLVSNVGFTSGASARANTSGIRLEIKTLKEAEELDWAEYITKTCHAGFGECWGRVRWEYSESGTTFGACSDCGENHFHCGRCDSTFTCSPGCDTSIGEVHIHCEQCGACILVGMEKGDVTDVEECAEHSPK